MGARAPTAAQKTHNHYSSGGDLAGPYCFFNSLGLPSFSFFLSFDIIVLSHQVC